MRFSRWQTGAVTSVAAVYVTTLLAVADRVMPFLFSASDTAFLPVAANLTRHYGLHFANSTNGQTSFTSLLVDLVCVQLPFRFGAMQAWPVLSALGGIAVACWAIARLTDRTVAWVTFVLAGGQTVYVLTVTAVQGSHSVTLVSLDVLAVVLAAGAAGWFDRRRVWLVAAPTGLVLGMNVTSDPMLVTAGFVPFVVVAVAFWTRDRATLANLKVTATTVTAVAVVASVGAFVAVKALGMTFAGSSVTNPLHVERYVRQLGHNLVALRYVLPVPFALTWAWLRVRAALRPSRALDAFVWFWIATTFTLIGTFVVTGAATDAASRYVFKPLIVSTTMVVPLLMSASAWSRRLCAAAVSVSVLFGALTLVVANQREVQPELFTRRYEIARVLAAHDVRIGYAGYWTAASLAFGTDGRLEVFPVEHCGDTLCQFPTNSVDAWFQARRATRSFLMIDPTQTDYPLVRVPPALGPPREHLRVGPFDLYIFDYDLASRIVRRADRR